MFVGYVTKILSVGLVSKERGGREKLQTREGGKRQWMGGERRRERTGDMRMD